MFWGILSPLTGLAGLTGASETPKIASEHFIRRAYYRHGLLTARYWLPVMLAAVSVGVILIYPTIFLADFPSGAFPGQFLDNWTRYSSKEARPDLEPDFEMRQVWLRGDHMRALNTSVLLEAFHVRNWLLGADTTHEGEAVASNYLLYSPTLFWANSMQIFRSDLDVIGSINSPATNATFLGHELRPHATFASKVLQEGRIIGADALVLTLLSRTDEKLGPTWDAKLASLSDPSMQAKWAFASAAPPQSAIYEYKFQPFSFRQYWILACAYLGMGLYMTFSLRRLKAFRSRFGIVVTAVTQMTMSILASFTICGLLKINLAQIPQEAYPFVVLTIGLENIFRLINAVLAYPPEMLTTQRIANGIGDIGHASLVSAAQNLALLWVLSLFVSPGVAAFCAFAAVALLFDYFFLMTFFVAVLNVDIKRLELQDSLSRSNTALRRKTSERLYWIEALIHGRVPFSTRMAGSIVTLSFVMALQWHLSESSSPFTKVKSWSSSTIGHQLPTYDMDGSGRPLGHNDDQNLWAKDSVYARPAQFIHIIKPAKQSFTARIFDPVVLTIKGSDRSGMPVPQDSILYAIRGLAVRHFYPFALAVVFMVTFVTVLMNFLLWNEGVEAEDTELGTFSDQPLSCKLIETNHKLDIISLATSHAGSLVSIGLDKTINLVSQDASQTTTSHTSVRTLDSPSLSADSWPIERLAICPRSGQIATVTRQGHLFLGRISIARLERDINIKQPRACEDVYFDFVNIQSSTEDESQLLVISQDGRLIQHSKSGTKLSNLELPPDEPSVISAAVIQSTRSDLLILVLTDLGSIFRYHWEHDSHSWVKPPVDFSATSVAAPLATQAWLHSVPALGLVLLRTSDEIVVLNADTLSVLITYSTSAVKRHTLRALHSAPTICATCDGPACESFSLAYTSLPRNNLVMVTYAHPEDDACIRAAICMTGGHSQCKASPQTPLRSELPRAGKWETTSLQAVIGVRPTIGKHITRASNRGFTTAAADDSPLRRRRRQSSTERASCSGQKWEAYMFTHLGSRHSAPIKDIGDGDSQLFTLDLGPAARLSPSSVAVAVGNTIVAVTAVENPDLPSSADEGRGGLGAPRRRRSDLAAGPGVRRTTSRGRKGRSSLLGMTRRHNEGQE